MSPCGADHVIWAGTLRMLVFLPGLPAVIRDAPPSATWSVVFLGVFPAAIAHILWTYAQSRLPVSVATSFLYLSPVVAILVAWIWLREWPAPLSLLGGLLALAGVILVNAARIRAAAGRSPAARRG